MGPTHRDQTAQWRSARPVSATTSGCCTVATPGRWNQPLARRAFNGRWGLIDRVPRLWPPRRVSRSSDTEAPRVQWRLSSPEIAADLGVRAGEHEARVSPLEAHQERAVLAVHFHD